MSKEREDLRAYAEAAKKNTPNWCERPGGDWTQARGIISFQFIQAATPDAVIALIDDAAKTDELRKERDKLKEQVARVLELMDEGEIHNRRLDTELRQARAELAVLKDKAKAVADTTVALSREVRP